jgi:hypothetical protein
MDRDPSATPREPAPEQPPREPAAAASPRPQAATPPSPPAPPPSAEGVSSNGRTPPLPQLVIELRDLVVTYVKQQTIVPLKQLVRYVGYGIGGSLLLGFGVVFCAMAGLRALQTETNGTFADDWSWVPYVIMVVILMVGGALVWVLRGARRTGKEAR